jgi:cytochrome P450
VIELIFALSAAYILYVVVKQKFIYFKLRRQIPFVPSKSSWPKSLLYGNALDLQQEAAHNHLAHIFIKWHHDIKADIFGYNLLFMPRVYVFDKDLVTLIATSKHTVEFVKPPDMRVIFPENTHGLLILEGQEHNNAKKKLQPFFTQEAFHAMYPLITQKAQLLAIDLKDKDHISVKPILKKYLLALIAKIAFDYDLKDDAISNKFEIILSSSEFTMWQLFKVAFPIVSKLPLTSNLQRLEAIKVIYEEIDNVIYERMQQPTPSNDLLTKIMEITDFTKKPKQQLQHLREMIITFMGAGHETTTTTLTWALFELSKHPNIQQRLREEIKYKSAELVPTWDELHDIPYLEHVVMEVLRLHTPLMNVSRLATKDLIFKNIHFPKETVFTIAIDGRHMDNTLFENPECFDPTRWDKMTHEDPYSFLPFWTGYRACIGKQLALLEIKTVLAILTTQLEFKMDENSDLDIQYTITQRPKELIVTTHHVEE